MATVVVLARCSAPERVWSGAPTAPLAERGSVRFTVGAGGHRACSCCGARHVWDLGESVGARRVLRESWDDRQAVAKDAAEIAQPRVSNAEVTYFAMMTGSPQGAPGHRWPRK